MCKFLVDYRAAKNLTQDQLATLLGCSQGLVAGIEQGHRKMSYENAVKWGRVLGVDPRCLRPSPYPEYFDDNQKSVALP